MLNKQKQQKLMANAKRLMKQIYKIDELVKSMKYSKYILKLKHDIHDLHYELHNDIKR